MNTIALRPPASLPLPKLPSWREIKALIEGALLAVTHTATVRTGIADYVCGLINAGTPPGHIVMATTGDVTVATLTCASAAFGGASSGVSTAAAIVADTSAVGGTIAKAIFKNAAGTEVFRCSVTATGGGGDIEMNSVVISAGQTVSISSLTYTAPA